MSITDDEKWQARQERWSNIIDQVRAFIHEEHGGLDGLESRATVEYVCASGQEFGAQPSEISLARAVMVIAFEKPHAADEVAS